MKRYKRKFEESSYYSQGYFYPGPYFKNNNGVEIKFLIKELNKLETHLKDMEGIGWKKVKMNSVGEFEGTK